MLLTKICSYGNLKSRLLDKHLTSCHFHMVGKEAILSMKIINQQEKKYKHFPRIMEWGLSKSRFEGCGILLNLGMLFLLGFVIAGCGQSLQSLSPVQPVHNIADALKEQSIDPSADIVIPAIPSEDLAKPVLDKHGLETVGFRLVKAEEANTKNLSYIVAYSEYAYSFDDWKAFLADWATVQPQIELPKVNEDRKNVDVMLISDYPQAFNVQARQPFLTKTRDGITVSICYWRSADLDRKYNVGNAFSPFYETEAAHQGDKTDVYYVKITNERENNIIIDVKKCSIEDQGENVYPGMDYEDLRDRFLLMPRATGLYVKNGLEKAKEILLEKRMPIVQRQVGANRTGVKPGESVEGFIPFIEIKANAVDLTVTIPIEKAPPPGGVQRYQTIDFNFPFTHNRGIRNAQPSPQRY